MSRKFPIKSREWHENSLREMDTYDPDDKEAQILIAWHSTAANYWLFGEFHDLDGPAVEGPTGPIEIKREFQLALDEYGNPYMRHFAKDGPDVQTLAKFDAKGVTLRDVTIRVKGDRITYSIPDTVDQGGAIRQYYGPLAELLKMNPLSEPVLKSDIQEACEIHVREGGVSE